MASHHVRENALPAQTSGVEGKYSEVHSSKESAPQLHQCHQKVHNAYLSVYRSNLFDIGPVPIALA